MWIGAALFQSTTCLSVSKVTTLLCNIPSCSLNACVNCQSVEQTFIELTEYNCTNKNIIINNIYGKLFYLHLFYSIYVYSVYPVHLTMFPSSVCILSADRCLLLFNLQDSISQQTSHWTHCWWTSCKRQGKERLAKVRRFFASKGLFWSNDTAWSKNKHCSINECNLKNLRCTTWTVMLKIQVEKKTFSIYLFILFHGCTFPIYLCFLSVWWTFPQGVLSCDAKPGRARSNNLAERFLPWLPTWLPPLLSFFKKRNICV